MGNAAVQSGASASPAQQGEAAVSVQERPPRSRESFCVGRFESLTLEEKQREVILTPRYSQSSLFENETSPQGATASKGPDLTPRGALFNDSSTVQRKVADNDVTPVASNEFQMLTKSRSQRRSSEGTSSDTHEWDFGDNGDNEARRVSNRTVVGPNTEVGKGMLNQTLQFDNAVETICMTDKNWQLSAESRQRVRQFVRRGLWQGNRFCTGMKVAVRPLSGKRGCTETNSSQRLAVITKCHCLTYDILFLDDDTSQPKATPALQQSRTNSTASFEGKMSAHSPVESKVADRDPGIRRVATGRETELSVHQTRLIEPAEFKGGNRTLQAESVETVEHIIQSAAYPLLDDRYLKRFRESGAS